MKTKDLLTITAVALSTATLTVTTFLAGSLDAGTEADPLAAPIAKPKLVAHGVELTVAPADGRRFRTGDQPVFALHAVNTLDTSSQASVRITMHASAPVSPMSRAMPVPALLWQDLRLLTLQPGEIKTVTLPAETELPANCMISIALAEVDPLEKRSEAGDATIPSAAQLIPTTGRGVVVLNFSTAEPEANPAYALARQPGNLTRFPDR